MKSRPYQKRSKPKKTWKYRSQFRLPLSEREYLVSPRKSDFPHFYIGFNSSELMFTHWKPLKEICTHEITRVMFTWLAGNESKMYRRTLDLVYRLTMKETIQVGVFAPYREFVRKRFRVIVYPTILWLSWEKGDWVEHNRLEGSNFTVQELLEREVNTPLKIGCYKKVDCSEDLSDENTKRLFELAKRREG